MKKLFWFVVYLFCLCLMLAPTASATSLITNGSFELGAYDDSAHPGFTRLYAGSTAITGWVVGGDGVDWHVIEGDSAHFGKNGVDGSRFAVDLTLDEPTHGIISQTFATTVGTEYQLSFLLGSPRFSSVLTVIVGGVSQTFSLDAQDQYYFPWRSETLTFTATDFTTTLVFDGGNVQGGYWGPVIDNVSIERVSERVPTMTEGGAMILAILIISSTFWVIRRRKRAW